MEGQKEINLNGYPKLIPYECTEKILEQMRKNICKITIGEGQGQGTGFFCKIPFPDINNMIPVFITNNHVLNEDLLYKKNGKISIYIKEEKKIRNFELNDRMIYTSQKYDITIMEIKDVDGIKNYLELDDKIINDIINNNNEMMDYIGKTIYIIQYPDHELSVSYGILNNILEDKKYDFNHKCTTGKGSSGSAILNLDKKVIGVHKEYDGKYNNKGTFLNYPIKEFILKFSNKANIVPSNNTNSVNEKNNSDLANNNKSNKQQKFIEYETIKDLNIIENEELKKFNFHEGVQKNINVISEQCMKNIIEQMKRNICEIKIHPTTTNGFFCKIPFPNKNNMIPVFITNNNIIYKKLSNKDDTKITLHLKENDYIDNLYLNNRMVYTSKEYKVAIIEIKENDSINNEFLELDDKIIDDIISNNKDKKVEYINNIVYIIQYPIKSLGKQKLSASFGMIKEIGTFNYEFYYNCSKAEGAPGSPIFNINNNKIIGIYSQKFVRGNRIGDGIGIFLNYPIKEFIKQKYQ